MRRSPTWRAAARGDRQTAARQERVLRESGFPRKFADEALREASTPVCNHIKAAIAHSDGQWKADPVHANRHVHELHSQLVPLLQVVDTVLPKDSAVRIGLHDMASEALSDGAWAYAHRTNDWACATKFAETACSSASGEAQITKQTREIRTLRENAENDDWCSPGYWELAETDLKALESIREKTSSDDFDGALQALLALDPALAPPCAVVSRFA